VFKREALLFLNPVPLFTVSVYGELFPEELDVPERQQ
jgi:hypothetical protein